MGKIGRNELCPCGSGRKYKHCCLRQQPAGGPVSPMRRLKLSLAAEIDRIRQAAREGRETVLELGVFVLWANRAGDAWLLEVAESDAVQVAAAGEPAEVEIDENPETIAINWSHTFGIRDRRFYLTSYADKRETCLEDAPVKRVHAAVRRIRKKYSAEQLSRVHLDTPPPGQATG
ncbi:MAG: SEC-C domain-containing protein [Desulfobulbaceae bacterium]|nr:SEC-C domain-containing protein [Desulfobulbaceae bacterium]MDY0351453.1 SEC-C domain-containing protein [Desulfobulbaceae bacterium]